MLATDGNNYQILKNAVKGVKGISGLLCEIGVREGGSSNHIIDALIENNDTNRTHIGIDPYGQIDYNYKDNEVVTYDYTNEMKARALIGLYSLIQEKAPQLNFIFMNMTDFDFMSRFSDGVPVYKDRKSTKINTYALVYFDGPHTTRETLRETVFFSERAALGAIFVYDDVKDFYDHDAIKNYLLPCGWTTFETSETKNSYRKVR